MADSKFVSVKEQRRRKAVQQASDPAWRARALAAGIPERWIDLRKEVCALPTHIIMFIIGLHAGDEGDNTQFGDPIPKFTKKLKRGRPAGVPEHGKRAPKRSKNTKEKDKAGHVPKAPTDSLEHKVAGLLQGVDVVDAMASLDVPSPQKENKNKARARSYSLTGNPDLDQLLLLPSDGLDDDAHSVGSNGSLDSLLEDCAGREMAATAVAAGPRTLDRAPTNADWGCASSLAKFSAHVVQPVASVDFSVPDGNGGLAI